MIGLLLAAVGPLLPRLANEMHSNAFAALVVAGHPIGSLLAAVPAAVLARRFGIPRLMVGGGVLMTLATLLFVFPGHGPLIVLARIGQGASATVVWQSVFAWTLTNVGPSHRGRAIGLLLTASTVGGLAAPLLGALTTSLGTWLLLIPAVVMTVTTAYFLPLQPYELAPPTRSSDVVKAFRSRVGAAGIGLSAICALAGFAFGTRLPLLLDDSGVGPFGIALVASLIAAGVAVSNPLIGRLVDRQLHREVVVGGFLLAALALAGLTTAKDVLPLVLYALLAGVALPAPALPGSVFVSRAVAGAEIDQTIAQAISTLIWAPSALAGTILVGMVNGKAALIAVALTAITASSVIAAERTSRRRPQAAESTS